MSRLRLIGAALVLAGASIGCTSLVGLDGDYTSQDGATGSGGAMGSGGAAGVGGASSSAAGGMCAATDSDSNNCGMCGHSCLGTTCTDGRCQVDTVVSGVGIVRRMAIDASHIYWTSSKSLKIVPLGGGKPAEWQSLGLLEPYGITLDANTVYWTIPSGGANLDGAVGKRGKSEMAPSTVTTDPCQPREIVAVGEELLWTCQKPQSSSVKSISTTGKHGILELYKSMEVAADVAADGAYAYITVPAGGTVMKAQIAGDQEKQLAAMQVKPSAIAVDQATSMVFWTTLGADQGQGKVMKNATDGAPEEASTIAGNIGEPSSIAIDGDYVYWTDRAYRKVFRASRDGKSLLTLAINQVGADNITVQGGYVYWSTQDPAAPSSNAIRKVAK